MDGGNLLRSVLVSGACMVLLGILALRALGAPAAPGFQQGVLRTELSDASGKPRTTPYFDIANAFPRMPAITGTITIHNTGSLPARYQLRAADLRPSQHSLADVLVLRVQDPAGRVVYEGGLAGMLVRSAEPLAPAGGITYTIEIRWPDHGSRDNRFQGQSLSFGLRLDSEAAKGPA